MKRLAVGVLVGLAIAAADTANAATDPGAVPQGAAKALEQARIAAPPMVPAIFRDGCPPPTPAVACTWPHGPIYVTPGSGRRVLLHELGHQFDFQVLTDYQRDKFRWLVGSDNAWAEDPDSPAEQFAEAYSICAMPFRGSLLWSSSYGYDPKPRRHQRICLLIRRAGQTNG